MKSLNVEIHPDKTWLSRVKNGFEFLGFRISPTTIQPSTASVSRRVSNKEQKVAPPLYEQGASKKRIGQYLRRWLGWSLLAVTSTVASAAPGDPAADAGAGVCGSVTAPAGTRMSSPTTFGGESVLTLSTILSSNTSNLFASLSTGVGSYSFVIYSASPPVLGFIQPATTTATDQEPSITAGSSTTVFRTLGGDLNNNTCTYSYTLSSNASGELSRSDFAYYQLLPPAPSDPTAVPIFTPIGLIATISGLLWFGRRRKAIKLTQH